MVHTGLVEELHGGKTEVTGGMIVAYGQTNHPVIIVLKLPRFATICESKLTEWTVSSG